MATRIVLLGDTHLPRFGRVLPGPLADGLAAADLILHVGDITEPFVLDLLAAFAPVEAVAGNNDPPDLAETLGYVRVVEVEQLRLGMTHGHLGPGRTTPERAQRAFASTQPTVDAVCFGHSHQPLVQRREGTWLLNPGSPTDRRRQPAFSFLTLDVDGAVLRPHLVTYAAGRPRR
ncbi:MAG TPA: metallophosphoesterase [Candidatus Limnocylindrales bacterium]|nr:metallophosphoesterase [Candidatus Limnocylindrales bacterium]